ncbi:MAG: hypothetical protein G01um10143_717 [Parcubacteria group bacterium Gr01-1014_3]|nr:MAG: hypothetical protein G01um10143_717 [Parcubacteria group bacterium Gr01-1014_3]
MKKIQKIKELIQKYKREIVIFVLFFLISTISFGLGYMVASETNRAPIIIEKNSN